MNTTAALQLGLALLPIVNTGLTEFMRWLHSIRLTLQQSGEWTEGEEAAWRSALYAKTGDPAYLPDP